mgnify:CR=1 FL=1
MRLVMFPITYQHMKLVGMVGGGVVNVVGVLAVVVGEDYQGY